MAEAFSFFETEPLQPLAAVSAADNAIRHVEDVLLLAAELDMGHAMFERPFRPRLLESLGLAPDFTLMDVESPLQLRRAKATYFGTILAIAGLESVGYGWASESTKLVSDKFYNAQRRISDQTERYYSPPLTQLSRSGLRSVQPLAPAIWGWGVRTGLTHQSAGNAMHGSGLAIRLGTELYKARVKNKFLNIVSHLEPTING